MANGTIGCRRIPGGILNTGKFIQLPALGITAPEIPLCNIGAIGGIKAIQIKGFTGVLINKTYAAVRQFIDLSALSVQTAIFILNDVGPITALPVKHLQRFA